MIAVCAAAGIITSTIAKTGLGQILADSLVKAAEALAPNQATLVALTALFAAIAILILGLAVPVTASFILSWVIIGPALIQLGVGAPETAMFIFYYAVLSEVSPPTALAAVASAAITGGQVIPTMWQACKYTLPAFLAPLAFVITDNGSLLLGRGNLVAVIGATVVCGLAVLRTRGRHHRLDVRPHPAPGAAARPRGGPAPAVPRAGLDGHRRRRPRGGGRPAPAHPHEEQHAHIRFPPTERGGHPMKRKLPLLAAGLLASLTLVACGGQQAGDEAGSGAEEDSCDAGGGRISIATGNSTGVYYVVGGGLAKLVNDDTDVQATSAETGASVQNIEQLVKGDYDVAFSLADTAADAVNGGGDFDGEQDVSALGRIYSNYTQVVVRKDSGITSVADFKGKSISTGSPQSGTEVIANRLIEAAGLETSDVKAQRLDLTKTIDGMKDGSIDGLVWSGGLPTPAITDLFTSQGSDVEMLDVTELLPKLQEISPVYEEAPDPRCDVQDAR